MKKFPHALALAFVYALISASPSHACGWDDDTLAQEAEGIKDIVSIIVGAFPRNPPLYYEMRIERSKTRIAADAQDWEAYDNAGVGSDRIGKHDEAIAFMHAKIAAMKEAGYDGSTQAQPNHSYRTKANLGTFYAHRWFANGKNFDDLSDIVEARKLIAAAIEENPDAHFGREIYQLKILQWLEGNPTLVKPTFGENGSAYSLYPDCMGLHKLKLYEVPEEDRKHMLDGLAGLMKMGAAWESVDVLHCMRMIADSFGHSSVGGLIDLRIEELQAKGRDYLLAWEATDEEKADGAKGDRWQDHMRMDPRMPHREFNDLRGQAEGWHAARLAHVQHKLARGEHPDTNSDFWRGFKNHAGFIVKIEDRRPPRKESEMMEPVWHAAQHSVEFARWFWGLVAVCLLLGGVGGFFLVRWRYGKKLKQLQSSNESLRRLAAG